MGRHRPGSGWESPWQSAITAAVRSWDDRARIHCEPFEYDRWFETAPINALTYAAAPARLIASLARHSAADLLAARSGGGAAAERVRWTAGMVAQWATDGALRQELQAALVQQAVRFFRRAGPCVIAAHSLGSLIAYGALRGRTGAPRGITFLSFGSQIGHPAVRDTLGGRIAPLPRLRRWWHIHNPHDPMFTRPLTIRAPNFSAIEAPFRARGTSDHDSARYLAHEAVRRTVWREVAASRRGDASRFHQREAR